MWELGQFGSRAAFRQDDLSGLGTQDYRNEQNSSCFSLWLEVRHVAGEEFFDDPTEFGWVSEKGQAPGIHSMQPGFWHPLNRPARNIESAEWIAFALKKLRWSPLAAQLLGLEFIFRPRAVQCSESGGQSELS